MVFLVVYVMMLVLGVFVIVEVGGVIVFEVGVVFVVVFIVVVLVVVLVIMDDENFVGGCVDWDGG